MDELLEAATPAFGHERVETHNLKVAQPRDAQGDCGLLCFFRASAPRCHSRFVGRVLRNCLEHPNQC